MTADKRRANAWLWLPLGLLAAGALGCSRLSQRECDDLRGKGFDIVNEAHPCDSDADCVGTEWPGCTKPVSMKNFERIQAEHAKFKKGKCEEPERKCPETPEVYCKQGLCVFRELPPPSG